MIMEIVKPIFLEDIGFFMLHKNKFQYIDRISLVIYHILYNKRYLKKEGYHAANNKDNKRYYIKDRL